MRTTLDVILGFQAKTAELTTAAAAVDRLGKRFDAVFSSVKQLAGGVLAIGTLTSAVRRLSGEAFQMAERFGNLSSRMNIGFENVQVLDRIARNFGKTADVFTGAFDSLQKKLAEARQGSAEAIEPFRQLGLTISELGDLSPDRQLEALAVAMVRATNESEAFLAVSKILGTGATPQLQAALRQLGTEGFDRLAQAARDAGHIMSESTGAALGEAKKQIEEFGNTVVVYWAERLGRLAQAANDLRNRPELSPADTERKITAEAIMRMQAEARSVRSETERAAMLERLRAQAERLEALEQAEVYADADRRVPLSDSERVRREGIGQQARAARSAIAFLEREGSDQIARNASAEAEQTAAKAAHERADAEREAHAWLARNRAQIEAQQRAYEHSLLADMDRLQALRERLALIDQETEAAVRAAGSEAEAERARLEAVQARLPVLAELYALDEKIAREKERAAEAAERAAAAEARSASRTASKPSGEELIELQRQLETVNALRSGVDGISRALADAAVSGKNFGDTMKDVLQQVIRDLIAATIRAIILRAVMSMAGGGYEMGGAVPNVHGYAEGGYTGPGPKNRVAGVVHGGEYVFTKREVDTAGLSYFAGISRAIRSGRGYEAGGVVGSLPAGPGARQLSVHVTNNYEVGVSPQELAQLVPVLEERTRAGVLEAMRRGQDGF